MTHTVISTRVGVTLGDPSGIGPEIVAKSICQLTSGERDRLRIFGDKSLLYPWLEKSLHTQIDAIPQLYLESGPSLGFELGQPNLESGRAQVAYLESAVKAVKDGQIEAIATAPIHKASAQRAGFQFPGHTEFFSSRLQSDGVAMMFSGPKLKVVLATVHVPLAKVSKKLSIEGLSRTIDLAVQALRRDYLISTPTIAVLGLNPHAGETGLFGREEIEVIGPAIQAAQKRYGDTCTLLGPLVPDAAFRQKADLFVCMYHDQGLIPVKLVDFDDSVNVTLGLSVVRTSPDHGVAHDIAQRGVARPTSMLAALRLALKLSAQRTANSAKEA